MSANRISRTKVIDGVVTPAFIHNLQFFFVNLQVYADGLVDCWELLDLKLFKQKLVQGWVTPYVPDGGVLSVDGLGAWSVSDGQWQLTAPSLLERVTELVRELNPRMENLHDCHGRTDEKIGKVSVAILGSTKERPIRISGKRPFEDRIKGDELSVFVRVDGVQYLADLRAFADGVIELGRVPKPETLDLDQLRTAVAEGRVCSTAPAGTRIAIHQLGSFTARWEGSSTNIDDIVRSVPDLVDAANDRPDSVRRCRAAYEAYVADPTVQTRDALRTAYEAIPSHNRMYVGDMDTKDSEVRMILYGEESA